MTYKYTDDDYCDIYENKVCDNCGKCLEIDGIDTKAIRIEDIAKNQEQNELLEEEFLNDLKSSLDEDELKEIEKENLSLKDIYEKFSKTSDETISYDGDYVDAFEHVEYLDGMDIDVDEATEEIYPGVRRIRKKTEE